MTNYTIQVMTAEEIETLLGHWETASIKDLAHLLIVVKDLQANDKQDGKIDTVRLADMTYILEDLLQSKTIVKEIDGYGFPKITVRTVEGGTVGISDYRKESEDGVDIGTVRIINQHGLGSNNYIRNNQDIENHISSIQRVTWLDNYQKYNLIAFLEDMRA